MSIVSNTFLRPFAYDTVWSNYFRSFADAVSSPEPPEFFSSAA
jgi:hypothetical protein